MKRARIPHYFTARSGEPLAFAGLWESWRDPAGAERLSATIVVRAANAWMSTYHARQPMILKWRDVNAWMAGDDPAALLRPVREWIVSTRVNKAGVGDDDPALIDAA